jgi:hypothetical protein
MKVSSTSLLQAFGNPKKKIKVNIFDGSSLAFGNSKKEMERSFICSSPSFLCHIHQKNPNINVIQHWQSSSSKKEYQLCSFVHCRHQKKIQMNLHIMVQQKNLQNKGKSKKKHCGLNP